MTRLATVAALAMAAVCCSGKKEPALTRETVLPLLQAEARSFKADGEKMDPKLGVKATWTVTAVEVQEQAGNKSQPFRGTVRFRIDSQMREFDGTALTQTFEKKFDFVFDAPSKKWLFHP